MIDLQVCAAILNSLERAGITQIEQLLTMPDAELRKIPGLGASRISAIRHALAEQYGWQDSGRIERIRKTRAKLLRYRKMVERLEEELAALQRR